MRTPRFECWVARAGGRWKFWAVSRSTWWLALLATLLAAALYAQAPFFTLGDLLAARGFPSEWQRQPDGLIVTARLNPAARDFEARYGAGSSTRKGDRGEAICADFILELLGDLGLPAGYRISAQDVQDLRMVPKGYAWLRATYRTKFKVEPCSGVTPPSPGATCPAGQACRPEPTVCPPVVTCPGCPEPLPCPVLPERMCPAPPEAILVARARLAAAAALSRNRPVAIGPALRGYITRLLGWKPCLESTGRVPVGLALPGS